MGADGGFYAVKAKDVREKWPEIREAMLREVDRQRGHNHMYTFEAQAWVDVPEIPESCGDTDAEVLLTLRSIFLNCDTPYLLGDWIILASGTNVEAVADCLGEAVAHCVPRQYVETWT